MAIGGVNPIDPGWDFGSPVNVQKACVTGPTDRTKTLEVTRNLAHAPICGRKHRNPLLWIQPCNVLTVRRWYKGDGSFRSDRLGRATSQIRDVRAQKMSVLRSGEDEMF